MVAAAPAIVGGSAAVMRGLINTSGMQGRARIGALTTGEAVGRRTVQAPAALRSAAVTASAQVVRMAGTAGRCVMRVRWSGQDKPRQTYVCAQASRHSRHVPPTHMHVCAHTCAHTSNQAQNIPWYSPRLPLAGVGVRYGQTVRALLRPCGPCQYGGSGDRSVPVVRAHTHGQCERSRYRV
jgi:hypothetical protein